MQSGRIKVLHIIKSLGRGGAEMLLPETLRLHDRGRFEFHYIYFLPWKDQMVGALKEAGGSVHCFEAKHNPGILRQYKKIIRYIEEHGIQVVHCHLPWAGFVGRLVKRKAGLPVVYTEHNVQERYHRLTYWINKMSFGLQDEVIAVSEEVAFSIHAHIHSPVPVRIINNGIDTAKFTRDVAAGAQLRATLGLPEGALVVGTVAVFRSQKRLTEWLEVFGRVAANEPQLYGIMVGDGPLRDEVEKKIRQLKLEGRVLLPGLQEDMRPWLSAMDIFMMSSVFEGLPLALLEAMSMECAVVSTDAGGIKEVIRHEVDGFMVPAAEWLQLEGYLGKLCRAPLLRETMGNNARKKIIDQYSLQNMVSALEVVYRHHGNGVS